MGMDTEFHPTFSWACDYLSLLGLKLNVSKRGAWCFICGFIPCLCIPVEWKGLCYIDGILPKEPFRTNLRELMKRKTRGTHLPKCHIYASVTWVSIGSGNGLSPVRRQAITWATADLLSIEPLGTNFSEIWLQYKLFIHENAYENVVCAMAPFCPGEPYPPCLHMADRALLAGYPRYDTCWYGGPALWQQ